MGNVMYCCPCNEEDVDEDKVDIIEVETPIETPVDTVKIPNNINLLQVLMNQEQTIPRPDNIDIKEALISL